MVQKRENRLILLCFLVYTIAYLGRYSYNANITMIEAAFGVPHADAGLVTTCFFISYGAGQIINGIFCRRYNKRYVLSGVLLISSVINLTVFFGIPFPLIKYLWLVNGAAQSVLWSSLASVLAKNLSDLAINRSVLTMATTTSVGTLIAYMLASLLSMTGDYRYSFLVGAVAMTAVSLLWFFGYPGCTKGEGVAPSEERVKEEKAEGRKASPLGLALWIMLGTMAFFAIADNLTKDGLQTWVPSILKENFRLPDSFSIILTLVLPILGIFGAMLASVIYKRLKNFTFVCGILFILSAAALLGVVFLLETAHWWAVLLLFGCINLFMHGINNVITNLMPMQMRNRLDAGKTSGILNGFCYVGSAISSYLLGFVADVNGWSSVFLLLLSVCLFSILLFLVQLIAGRFMTKKDAV